MTIRIGNGFDVHALVAGRRLVLGGVTIPSDWGALGHSDADVVCHAVIDAPQDGQREFGNTIDSSRGRRWITTLRKLPMMAPKRPATM